MRGIVTIRPRQETPGNYWKADLIDQVKALVNEEKVNPETAEPNKLRKDN